jgi:uncharacterized protein (TIGR04562 family)
MGKQEDFGEFIDRQNELAPLQGFGRSLGYSEAQATSVREAASAAVDRVLSKKGAEGLDPMALRELLMADLKPFLRSDSQDDLSMMDLPNLGLTEDSHIRARLKSHGIDLATKEGLAEALKVFEEAVEFFDHNIGTPRTRINERYRTLKTEEDIYRIFKVAAGSVPGIPRSYHIPQCCALLRIALGINHLNNDTLLPLIPVVAPQLREMITSHLKKEPGGRDYYLDFPGQGQVGIPVSRVVMGTKKRDRILMKLLQKPSNRLEEVKDLLRLRIVTKEPEDVLKLIYKMFFMNGSQFMPSMYIRIDESTQKLLKPDVLSAALRNADQAATLFDELATEVKDDGDEDTTVLVGDNQHSSIKYSAIHLTVDVVFEVEGQKVQISVELQVVDVRRKDMNERVAPHHEYAERQRKAVTDRVHGNNLSTLFAAEKARPRRERQARRKRSTGGED